MNRDHPTFEVTERRLGQSGVTRQPFDLNFEQLARASQAAANRAMRYVEDDGKIGPGHALPVRQLDCDLQLKGESSQRAQQQGLLFVLDDELTGSRVEFSDAALLELRPALARESTFAIAQDLFASHREQEGAG